MPEQTPSELVDRAALKALRAGGYVVIPESAAEHACNGERNATKHYCGHCGVNDEQMRSVRHEVAQLAVAARVSRDLAVVVLRMLQRTGKVKAVTDDERAAIQLLEYEASMPAGNRWVLNPGVPPMPRDEYIERVVAAGQAVLFDEREAA